MRCRKSVATAVPQLKGPLRTRSRICAVSISEDYMHAGRASFRDRALFTLRGICYLQSSPIGFRPIALAISIAQPGRCWIEGLRRKARKHLRDRVQNLNLLDTRDQYEQPGNERQHPHEISRKLSPAPTGSAERSI